jgi:DNA repair exonuclease SbcCD ATPase subunit
LEDRIAALVNGEVILLSQLRVEARLNLLRTGVSVQVLDKIPKESWPALLDMLIAHRLWAASSEKAELSIEQLSSVALMTEQLKAAFGSEADYQQFLQKYEMDSGELRAIVERIVRAESNLQAKIRLRAQPNEAEIQQAREASPELSEAQIRTKLYEEKFKFLSKQELEAQRKKADVRILLNFSRIGDVG